MNEFVILNYGLLGRETVIYTVYLIPALGFTLGQSKFIPMGTKMVGSNLWDEKICSQQFCEEKVESEITIGEVSSSHSWVGPSPSHSSPSQLPGISHDLSAETRRQSSAGQSSRLLACLDAIACHARSSVVVTVFALLCALFLLACLLWLLVVSQGLTVHPRLISSSQSSCISFQSNSMSSSYCSRQTYWDKLFRHCLMPLAMSGRTKTVFCVISWVYSWFFLILTSWESQCNPNWVPIWI